MDNNYDENGQWIRPANFNMSYSELKKLYDDTYKDYNAIEPNALKQITGDSLDEKIQKANWTVNESIQNFIKSDEYMNMIHTMIDAYGPDDEATAYLGEEDFYLYVNEKDTDVLKNICRDEDDKDVIVKLENGEDMFVTESMIKPCKELKGAYKVRVGYDQKVPAVNPGTREAKQITGTDLFNEMAEKLGKDVQKAEEHSVRIQQAEKFPDDFQSSQLTPEENDEFDKIMQDKVAHPEKYRNLNHKTVPLDFEAVAKMAENSRSEEQKEDSPAD